MRIKGLSKFQKELERLSKLSNSLDGASAEVQFEPNDPASVEQAIFDAEMQVLAQLERTGTGVWSDAVVAGIGTNIRESILESARLQQLEYGGEGDMQDDVFERIRDVISDLQSSESASWSGHWRQLALALNREELREYNERLVQGVNFEQFFRDSAATAGSFVGSASLVWPDDRNQQLGLVLQLVQKAAVDVRTTDSFVHLFFYDKQLAVMRRKLVSNVLIPFARDYQKYINAQESMKVTAMPRRQTGASTKVFIVHGREGGPKYDVARFIEKLGLKSVILDEQANRGCTIIEKIEQNSDVGFAVVLLTPDDVGALKGDESNLQPRARQNVLLELGYFIGLLGRARVCALRCDDVEIPSDFAGNLWIDYGSHGGWKRQLAQELREAGYVINLEAMVT